MLIKGSVRKSKEKEMIAHRIAARQKVTRLAEIDLDTESNWNQ